MVLVPGDRVKVSSAVLGMLNTGTVDIISDNGKSILIELDKIATVPITAFGENGENGDGILITGCMPLSRVNGDEDIGTALWGGEWRIEKCP